MSQLKSFVFTVVLASALCAGAAQGQVFGRNLIVNGDAESGPGTDGTAAAASIAGWTVTGSANVVTYSSAYDLTDTGFVPVTHGKNYFTGGPGKGTSTLTQTLDLTAGAANIDAGTVTFNASAYLGGNGDDQSIMKVVFAGASGSQLGNISLGPVLQIDRPDGPGLFFRRQIGPVPAGTRTATVTLQMNPTSTTKNRGYADNLVLVLNTTEASSLFGPNLIANGDAESAPASSSSDVTPDIPGWVRTASFSVDSYADDTGDLSTTSAGPATRGANYFWGGPSNEDSSAYQDIDISSAAGQIDTGRLTYNFSAWVGGFSSQGDNMTITADFRNWAGASLGKATLGPVNSADRNDESALLSRDQTGTVPSGTRYVRILMRSVRTDGSDNDGLADNLSFTLASSSGGALPVISADGVVSAGAFGGFKTIAPGSWIEIYGTGLASTTSEWGGADFQNGRAPTTLSGVSVSIGGKPAFVRFVSPGQVNVQVSSDVAAGTQPITVRNANGTSVAYPIIVNSVQPGVLAPTSFVLGGKQFAAATFSDGTFVLPAGSLTGTTTRSAKPGDVIVFYGVGFGPVTPSILAGQIVSGSNQLTLPLNVMFGKTQAEVTYQGLAPNYVGLYQFNVVVPAVSTSTAVPVTFGLGGVQTAQTLYTSVQ